jgi:hypothetical protein
MIEVGGADARPEAESAARPDRAPLAVAVLGGLIVALTKAAGPFDTDAWWHLKTGRQILDDRRLPRTDPFSWTAAHKHWRLNGWLFDAFDGALDRIGGPAAASVVMLACIVGLAAVLYTVCRHAGARPWPSAAIAVVATYIASPFAAERPQSVSFLLFPLAIALGRRALAGSNRALMQLGVLVVFWANLHLSFTGAVACVGLLAAVEAVVTRAIRRPALVVAVITVAGVVTPYGIGSFTASLGVRGDSKAVHIKEWERLDPRQLPQLCALLLLVACAFALVRTGRWRDPRVVAPIALFAALTIDAQRNIPFAMALVAPEIALGWPALRGAIADYSRSRRQPIIAGSLIGLAVVAIAYASAVTDLRPATPRIYPVRAVQAIPGGCRLLNEYKDGGYIIEKRWPDVLVSEDGRNDLYGVDLLRTQQDVLDAKGNWSGWLDRNAVDCVLANPHREIVTELQSRGWTVAVREHAGVLLLRP